MLRVRSKLLHLQLIAKKCSLNNVSINSYNYTMHCINIAMP